MRCEYCDVEVVRYPDDGICVCCGAKLPPRPAEKPAQPVVVPLQPVYIPVPSQPVYSAGTISCPKCRGFQVTTVKRGYSWGLGILGFFLFPAIGFLFGFLGAKKPRLQCRACHHKWKQR